MSWFRLHNDILENPKLLMVAESDRWRFVAICSLKSQGILDSYDGDKLAKVVCAKLRLTRSEWDETSRRLQDEQLIDEKLNPVGWDDRQYKSDSSAERVRKHREKKKSGKATAKQRPAARNADVTLHETLHETPMQRCSNADVTPPDTDTDTDKTVSTPSEYSSEQPAADSDQARDPVPFVKIVDLYHRVLPELPRCAYLSAARKGQLRQRHVHDLKSLERWEEYFEAVRRSNFLMGRSNPSNGRPPFIASLDWLTKQANFLKVAEGNYHRE